MEYYGQDWEGVPPHLLDSILNKLVATKDFLQFGVVSQTWHSVAKDHQIERVKRPLQKQVPMLLVSADKHERTRRSFYDISNNKLLTSKLKFPYEKRFCGSSQGWLAAVNEDWLVTLYKPFSTVDNKCPRINLPSVFPLGPEALNPADRYPGCINWAQFYEFHVRKVIITADPLLNRDECVIVVVFADLDNLAYIRLSQDSTWTQIRIGDGIESYVGQDIIHYKDRLFSVNSKGQVHSFDLKDPCNSTLKLVVPRNGIKLHSVKRYLIESCDGKLYLVRRYLEFGYNGIDVVSRETKKFRVFKLDLSRGKLKAAKDLRNNAFFLGDNSSICVEASNVGCQPNCIYFTEDYACFIYLLSDPVSYDLGIYNVQRKKFNFHFNLNSDALSDVNSRPPIWVLPTFDAY